ncbi:MAG: hypothetical protein IPG16_22500 [Comamonadaceae bacterium]|nr:hypothetical protein [Comamonadaceae bacterium]
MIDLRLRNEAAYADIEGIRALNLTLLPLLLRWNNRCLGQGNALSIRSRATICEVGQESG